MARRSTAQGATTRNGYGVRHQAERRRVKRVVDAGQATCFRCGQPISPHEKWDLDHLDHPDAKTLGLYGGPSHRACNRDLTGRSAQRRSQTPPPRALSFFDKK